MENTLAVGDRDLVNKVVYHLRPIARGDITVHGEGILHGSGGNTSAVAAVQPNLTASENTLVTSIANVGGVQTRIEASQTQQADRLTSIDGLVSAEADADLPSTIVKLNQTQTAYQAALQSAVNIMKTSLLDYLK